MAIGVMITGLVCYLLKQDDALRPSFVAVIIVTLFGGANEWHNSVNRVTGVLLGCACALIVGLCFHLLTARWRESSRNQPKTDE